MLEQFPQGIWFTELAGLNDPDLVPRTLLSVFGLPESSTIALMDQLKDYLKDRQLLIVLDNCEHVIADCARIAEALLRSCPGLKILASSREALSIAGEATYHVPSLAVPDPRQLPPLEELAQYNAVQLFTERAASVSPGFGITTSNAAAVAQVCRRLDGIPLAIELAAARVGSLSVEQIASRLDNRFRLLTGGSRTAVPRQQTLRASIDWSYSLLSEPERMLLMRLSVFHNGWNLELASEVCAFDGLDEYDVLDGLGQLVQKSLIFTVSSVDGENRYRRLETIRQYAREKLLDSGASEAVYDRHLEAFFNLALTAEPHLRAHGQVEWLDRLELELDNLRAALEWALEGDAQKGLRLATSLYWFWHIRGYRQESERWLARLIEQVRLQPGVDQALLAEALGRRAMLLCAIGQVGESTAALAKDALAAAQKLGDAGMRIQFIALHALAWNAGFLYQKQILYERFLQCMEIAQALGDRFLLAEAAQNLSYVEPDHARSRKYAEMNLALRRELGDLDGLMTAEALIAGFYYSTGDYAQACFHYEASIQLAQKIKNVIGALSSYGGIGRVYYVKGELDKSIHYFTSALELVQEVGEQNWVIWLSSALIYAYGALKDWLAAEHCFHQGFQIAQDTHNVYWETLLHINFAEVAWSFGKQELAVQHYDAATEISRERQDLPLAWLLAYSSGRAALLRGDLAAADRFLRQALVETANQNNLDTIGGFLESLLACAVQAGQFERAVQLHGIIASQRWLRDPVMPLWLVPYDLDSLLAPARSALGGAEYNRLYEEGQLLTLEQVLVLAAKASDD
jgi:predicted ATPase